MKNILEKYYTMDAELNNDYIIDVDCPHSNGLDLATILVIHELEIDQDVTSDIQSSLDIFMKGGLLRGFWYK